ncbi:MAG: hypothetical protein K9H64_18155 [Bacteroidales bacterium]|nr:hypothetical protein [Bacteroidales bacterium]MCF8457959.1 hypothetical protein [Bacteroidales bacterium]
MIKFRNISNNELDNYIKRLDVRISFIHSEFNIELKSYENILRIAINAIQNETIENLIERVSMNRELEKGLDNFGGYTVDYLGENNPKVELLKTLQYLKENSPKQQVLLKYLNEIDKKTIAFFDNNDLDFATKQIRNRKVDILPFSELKKVDTKKKVLVFHSFNGQRDFDLLYNLENEITLIIYKQEKNLYYKYLDQRKKQIEQEIKSNDRLLICGIEYKETRDNVTDISTTINGIVTRLDDLGNRAYEGYKNECDLLLNEIEEKLIYKVQTDKATLFLESIDTIFSDKGELMKCYKIKIGNKIRIYPKVLLAENLYHVAVETEPEIFGKVEEHSIYWKQLITELRNKFGDDLLYQNLREKGLRILPMTLSTYGKGYRKFPMFKNDLRAILKLHYQDKSENEIDVIIKPVLKSKTTYNSTMIVLGRGLKQELRLFLKEMKIGEILQKRNFNVNTLQTFVDEFMPIHTVISKELFSDSIETLEESTLQLIEL